MTTLHGRLDLPEQQPIFNTFNTCRWCRFPIAASAAAAGQLAATVYHGLPEQLLKPKPVKPGYLAFLGRISPEKRVDRRSASPGCGMKIKIAAKVDKADRAYYEERSGR